MKPAAIPTIRVATADDAEAIHALVVGLATYEREPHKVKVTVERLREQLASERPPFECVLAERDGAAVGFALFFQTYSTWEGRPGLYLEDLYVVEDERGRGTGQALIQRVARLAVERDCGRLELAVLDWNTPAIGFYERHGGMPMSDWIVYRFAGDALGELGSDAEDAGGELRAS